MRNRIKRAAALVLCAVLTVCFTGCVDLGLFDEPETTTVATTVPVTKPEVDPEVSDVLRVFYQDQLPTMALRSGVQDPQGEEIRCTFAMLQKTVFSDFDSDGQKEIILLYDIGEQAQKRGMNVVVFLDEQNGQPMVVSVEPGTYGASSDGDSHILTRYNDTVCRVRFQRRPAYEAVLIDTYQNGAWKTVVSAYRHISDHDGVKLENDSCYIDHAGGDLYKAAVSRELNYSTEKFLNFRTPNDNYNNLVTALLAETMLP